VLFSLLADTRQLEHAGNFSSFTISQATFEASLPEQAWTCMAHRLRVLIYPLFQAGHIRRNEVKAESFEIRQPKHNFSNLTNCIRPKVWKRKWSAQNGDHLGEGLVLFEQLS
jgi:hypothetical protein